MPTGTPPGRRTRVIWHLGNRSTSGSYSPGAKSVLISLLWLFLWPYHLNPKIRIQAFRKICLPSCPLASFPTASYHRGFCVAESTSLPSSSGGRSFPPKHLLLVDAFVSCTNLCRCLRTLLRLALSPRPSPTWSARDSVPLTLVLISRHPSLRNIPWPCK